MVKNTKYPNIIAYITLPGDFDSHSVRSASYVSTATLTAPHVIIIISVIGDKPLSNTPTAHITVKGIQVVASLAQKSQYPVMLRINNRLTA